MNCVLCNNEIAPERDASGKIVWEEGHNAEPCAAGRCCRECNEYRVIPKRLQHVKMYINSAPVIGT